MQKNAVFTKNTLKDMFCKNVGQSTSMWTKVQAKNFFRQTIANFVILHNISATLKTIKFPLNNNRTLSNIIYVVWPTVTKTQLDSEHAECDFR